LREIRGASELPARVLQRYRLSPVIVELIVLGSRAHDSDVVQSAE
jgi:hypothetical protein